MPFTQSPEEFASFVLWEANGNVNAALRLLDRYAATLAREFLASVAVILS